MTNPIQNSPSSLFKISLDSLREDLLKDENQLIKALQATPMAPSLDYSHYLDRAINNFFKTEEERNNLLCDAAQKGNLVVINSLLRGGINVDPIMRIVEKTLKECQNTP